MAKECTVIPTEKHYPSEKKITVILSEAEGPSGAC